MVVVGEQALAVLHVVHGLPGVRLPHFGHRGTFLERGRQWPDLIRFRVLNELDGLDLLHPEDPGFGEPVHSVHDMARGREDNRPVELGGVNALGMLSHSSAGGLQSG